VFAAQIIMNNFGLVFFPQYPNINFDVVELLFLELLETDGPLDVAMYLFPFLVEVDFLVQVLLCLSELFLDYFSN
jgi:hypothetical protein